MRNYHQLNPIIRLKEMTLLKPQEVEQMIAAKGFAEVEAVLQQTHYQRYLKPDFHERFETYLDEELLKTIKELAELVPDQEILRLYMMPFTFHNLKVLTKESVTGKDYDHLLIEDGFYTIDECRTAIKTGTSEVLPEKIVTTIQEVREYLEGGAVLQGIDIIYDRRYLHEQRRLADEIKIPELQEAVIKMIDLTNITIAARCVLQKRSRSFMEAVLVSVGSIPKEEFLAFADAFYSDFLAFLLESDYQEVLRPLIHEQVIDFAGLALLQDNLITESYGQAQTDALGPLPLLAFLNAKVLELQNLRLLLVGKRSGFTEEQLRERMRHYDS
ncbi:V-type ATPase subunit [Enterococcus casseliflavus]|uniref:V-type ATPase subunit n=1 Tax=Enterococcus casseliflavus TaxID=37734 RepID=UPI001AD6BF3B|nr:V-type ATPase subunit [Enterococcus casseliflavus]MBO6349726.1 V-type ATP synthase subunit C [Enterococcus casseliflavus]MBO6367984.1 V-type ATP synthase subunit C [Enterococcus casseliflavus]